MKSISQRFPKGMRRLVNRAMGRVITYRGPYTHLVDAKAATDGYASPSILQSVENATRRVLSGQARYEQDGISFTSEPSPDRLVLSLLLAASRSGGRLSVLDFGGGLASHYLRWKPLLCWLPELKWCVIEQPHYVAAGRAMFADDPQVHFENELEAAIECRPNVVLASGVLQYVDDPYFALQRLAGAGADLLIIDRTPFSDDGEHRYFSQHIPRQIYLASYPLQALSEARVASILTVGYLPLLRGTSADDSILAGGHRATFRSSIWLKRGPAA